MLYLEEKTIMTIAEQLKTERERCELSPQQLATKSTINVDTIKRIENGKNINPTIVILRLLGESLNNYRFEL